MEYDKERFWKKYKKELTDPITILIDNNQDISAAKLILSGIDSLAGFYSGRIGQGMVKKTFIDFVERYMPRFDKDVKFTGRTLINAKTLHEIKKPSEILYFILRNDLIHDGTIGVGVEVYRDENREMLWSGEGPQIFKINIIGFFEYYKVAIQEYEKDLNSDVTIMRNFTKKYDLVSGLEFDIK